MRTEKLHSLCHINSGGTPSRKNDSFYGGSILWAKIGDIERSDGVIYDTKEKITPEGLENIRNRIFPTGTLLFSMYGSVGKVAFAGKEMSTNQAILGIRIKDDAINKLNIDYLKFWFEANLEILKDRAVGGILKNLSATIVKGFDIPLPSIENQLCIVKVLSKCDDLIKKRKESINLMDKFLKSIFLEMFGDPVKNEKDWQTAPLESLINKERGISYGIVQRGNNVENGTPVIRIRDVISKDFNKDKLVKTTKEISDKYKRTIIEGGEFLISIRGTVGKLAIAPLKAHGWNVSREVAVIPVQSLINHEFLLNQLESEPIQREILNNVIGVAQSGINLAYLRKIEVIEPDIKSQELFAEVSKKVKILIQQAENSLIKLENLYGSIGKKAFNGELHLNVFDIKDLGGYKKKDKEPMSEKKIDVTFMSLADYFDIPRDIQTEQENIELTFINDDRFYQFFLKKYFKDKSFLMEDIEKLFNQIYIPEGVDFEYEAWKEYIFNSLKSDAPIIEQYFDESQKVKQVKLKLTDEAFKA